MKFNVVSEEFKFVWWHPCFRTNHSKYKAFVIDIRINDIWVRMQFVIALIVTGIQLMGEKGVRTKFEWKWELRPLNIAKESIGLANGLKCYH